MHSAEAIAERIVLRETGGRVIERDDQSRPGMVDLIVETADYGQVAIEVTTLTSEAAAARHAAWTKFGGPCDVLGRTWVVHFLRRTRVKKLRDALVALLRDLEAAGVRRLHRACATTGVQDFVKGFRALGVLDVASVNTQAGYSSLVGTSALPMRQARSSSM